MTVTLRRVSSSAAWTGASSGSFSNILSARGSFGFDSRVGQLILVTPTKPACTYDDIVTWTAGVVGSHVITRFVGIVRDFQYSQAPRGVATIIKGELQRALEYENGEDPSLVGGLTISDLTGDDLATASVIVQAVLTKVGVPFTPANIGGTATLYGDAFEVFIWRNGASDNPMIDYAEAGESALGYIERYDAIDATFAAGSPSTGGRYRTFETLGGVVYRYFVGGRPRSTQDFTFTETVDILDGSFDRSISDTRNYFLVTGYDDGSGGGSAVGSGAGPEYFAVQDSNSFQSSATKHTYRFSSPMIERSNDADSGTGMSCETMANAISLEFNREIVKGWISTHRDDALGIAQTHLVQANGGLVDRLGVAEKLWVQTLDISVDEQGFTQRIGYLGGGAPDTALPAPP